MFNLWRRNQDQYEPTIRQALTAEGWRLTRGEFRLAFDQRTARVDIGAQLITAEARSVKRRIAVEVKDFLGRSVVADLEQAVGQYLVYRSWMARVDPMREVCWVLPPKPLRTSLTVHSAGFWWPITTFTCWWSIRKRSPSIGDGGMMKPDYSTITRRILAAEAEVEVAGDLTPIVIEDIAQGRYLLAYVGWTPAGTYAHEVVLHMLVTQHSVRLIYDGMDITPRLIEAGVRERDISYAYREREHVMI
jgi:XisH protein/XisI protein